MNRRQEKIEKIKVEGAVALTGQEHLYLRAFETHGCFDRQNGTGILSRVQLQAASPPHKSLCSTNGNSVISNRRGLGCYFEVRVTKKKGVSDRYELLGYKSCFVSGSVPSTVRAHFEKLFEIGEVTCEICGLRINPSDLNIDHRSGRWSEISDFNPQEISNYQASHRDCNARKRGACQSCQKYSRPPEMCGTLQPAQTALGSCSECRLAVGFKVWYRSVSS